MELDAMFVAKMKDVSNEYDMIAICFEEFLKAEPKADKDFYSKYIESMETREEYFDEDKARIESLSMDIRRASGRIDDRKNPDLAQFRDELLKLWSEFKLEADPSQTTTWAICLFYALQALDGYVLRNVIEQKDNNIRVCGGPLNHAGESVCVYLKERSSFLNIGYQLGRNGFRKPLGEVTIGDVFGTFQIVRREELPGHPTEAPRILELAVNKGVLEDKRLRIAIIPFAAYPTFLFREEGKAEKLKLGEYPNGRFYVEYLSEKEKGEQESIARIERQLEAAVESRANLILFPEFVMSPAMRKAISKRLKRYKEEDDKNAEQLILVMVGTTFLLEDGNRHNNVLHMIKGNGVELSQTYYKYSPFCDEDAPTAHGMTELRKGKRFKLMEILDDKGKRCTLLDIESLGRLLPSVCRDAIDGAYTEPLAKMFRPSLCAVVAWSQSVSSFESGLEKLANTIHMATAMCDCCNAVGEQGNVGMVILPEKRGTAMRTLPHWATRSENCRKSCAECRGCHFLAEIAFDDLPTVVRLEKKP